MVIGVNDQASVVGLSADEIRRISQLGSIRADELPIEGTTSADLDMAHLNEYSERVFGHPIDQVLARDNLPIERLLNNLGLARGGSLNLTGLLIFGRQPQRFRPVYAVKAVSFAGNDPAGVSYRDSQDIEGCLRDLYKHTMSFLTRNLRRVQGSKGFNTVGDLEVPQLALEELVTNMLLHRDYFVSAPWRVMMFDDRIELVSPGSLPNNLTIENIKSGVSVVRNPLIVSFTTKGNELPYRGIGTGILRALAAVPELKLESDPERNLFIARIPRKTA